MLLYDSEYFYKGLLVYAFFAMLSAGHTYLANTHRSANDPEKRNYPPILIVLAPITWPLSILVSVLVFIGKALLYGLFLVMFAIGLLFASFVAAARRARTVYQK